MTLLELVKELNDFVETNLAEAQTEVDIFATQIVLTDGNRISWDDEADYDDCWEDDVDESNYDPYMGCDFYEDGGFFEDF